MHDLQTCEELAEFRSQWRSEVVEPITTNYRHFIEQREIHRQQQLKSSTRRTVIRRHVLDDHQIPEFLLEAEWKASELESYIHKLKTQCFLSFPDR